MPGTDTPVIGIIGNHHLINDQYEVQAVGRMNIEAVRDVCAAIPVILPADPDLMSVEQALAVCDGFVFPGGRPNVHPSEYGHEETPAHGTFDRPRDALSLALIREAVARGVPVLGLCRGFQEIAVAFGSTLHPEIRDIPGRLNHRMPPDGSIEEKFALRHWVTLTPGGPFARLFGATEVHTNTLHGQGIEEAGPRVVVDGRAPDGTAEAIHIEGAPGFAMAVQWHPEYRAAEDPVSRPLFEAFGAAARAGRLARAA
ncbi:gamma-glutamyl-gamma-aminobutyrate hydrolase family protein [Roseobacter sp. HKCCA0434]|uniref:gamma-glutamyl-gamma-aminobutyrate hydrolase family protein n=1 Tax=Roseobacter sp. HKCCA0434 TaxID=3079297 RepID=UPI002905AB9A|nr:gamma-glutamyl-gamma-aminobutyrate hydrolase family protein [Roseobacter sp. HKCCA0434]